mgnify:CR=1 FL=1
MENINKKFNLQIEVLTPLHVGAGAEKDWIQGCDFIIDDNKLKVLSLRKVSQFVNNTDLSNALLKKDTALLRSKLGEDLNECVEQEFRVKFVGTNDIKTFIKNGLSNNPIVPGSSLKGAIRSILVEYFLDDASKRSRKLNEDNLLGKASDGDSLFRFIKLADAEFTKTNLVNTKIFNLKTKTEGGWKHGANNTTDSYKPDGFNTFYEVLEPNQKSTLSLSIADVAFRNYAKIIKPFSSSKTKLINNDISFLFDLINKHTQEYLEKEKAFFEKYAADKTDLIIEGINSLLMQIPKNGEHCILKMAAGSGFHNITGDWQFDDYSIDRVYSEYQDRRTGQLKQKSRGNAIVDGKYQESAKSRKIAISGDKEFSLMGFVKLTVLDEKLLAEIEKERKAQLQIELTKLQHQQEEQRLLEQQRLDQESKKNEFESLISQAHSFYQNNDYKSALLLIEQAEALNLGIVSHNEFKQDILKAIEIQSKLEEVEALKQQEAEKRKAETEAKLASGLAAYLEEKNLNGDYKVNNFGMLKAKVEKYLKDASKEKLTKNEGDILKQNINRVYIGLKPRDQKEWMMFGKNKIWNDITDWTSIEVAKRIYNEVISN